MIMMKNTRQWLIILVVIALIFTFVNFAYTHNDLHNKANKHFLWTVEAGENTIYLLGSIHILKRDSYPLPEVIENIYNCCRIVVFETDLDGMNALDSRARLMKLGIYPAGQTLSKNISQQTYKLLKKKLAKAGLSIAQFEQFKPWFIALTIAAAEIQRLGFDPDLGIDRYFFNKARKSKKEMVFLETNEYQLNLMADLSRRQQESFLKETLNELEIVESMATDMLISWKTGNVEKLNSILKMSFDGYPDIYKRFFTQRNRKWKLMIEKLMKQNDDVLIIVGAGHLVGKDSVIELLRKKGYSIRQK